MTAWRILTHNDSCILTRKVDVNLVTCTNNVETL